MNNKTSRQWFGNLTLENADDFTERLQKMLAGKFYTFVSVNEARGYTPETKVNQYLGGRRNVKGIGGADNIAIDAYEDGRSWRHSIVCDSYGVWSLHAYSRESKESTYFVFEASDRHCPERVTITHKADAGNTLIWQISVQGPLPEDGNVWEAKQYVFDK